MLSFFKVMRVQKTILTPVLFWLWADWAYALLVLSSVMLRFYLFIWMVWWPVFISGLRSRALTGTVAHCCVSLIFFLSVFFNLVNYCAMVLHHGIAIILVPFLCDASTGSESSVPCAFFVGLCCAACVALFTCCQACCLVLFFFFCQPLLCCLCCAVMRQAPLCFIFCQPLLFCLCCTVYLPSGMLTKSSVHFCLQLRNSWFTVQCQWIVHYP